jgi:hypothetical protein
LLKTSLYKHCDLHHKKYTCTFIQIAYQCSSGLYCNLLWVSASQSLLKPLVSMQKKAIRSALNAPYNSHTDRLFAEINWLKFEDQYQLNAAKFANQIIEGEAPWGVSSSFKIIKPDKDSRHRKCTTLFVPTCRTDATQRMCSYTIPTIFNSQPEYFRNPKKGLNY